MHDKNDLLYSNSTHHLSFLEDQPKGESLRTKSDARQEFSSSSAVPADSVIVEGSDADRSNSDTNSSNTVETDRHSHMMDKKPDDYGESESSEVVEPFAMIPQEAGSLESGDIAQDTFTASHIDDQENSNTSTTIQDQEGSEDRLGAEPGSHSSERGAHSRGAVVTAILSRAGSLVGIGLFFVVLLCLIFAFITGKNMYSLSAAALSCVGFIFAVALIFVHSRHS